MERKNAAGKRSLDSSCIGAQRIWRERGVFRLAGSNPSGAKARAQIAMLMARLDSLVKKTMMLRARPKNVPQGLKLTLKMKHLRHD
jgi:hypothetical protein